MQFGRPSRDRSCRMPDALPCSCRCAIPGMQVFLLAFCLLSLGAAWPPGRHGASLPLEAVKRDILARLGTESPPAVRGPLDPDGIREAQQRYRGLLAQLRGNQTQRGPVATEIHLLRMEVTSADQAFPARRQGPGGRPAPSYGLELDRTVALHRGLRVLRAEVSLFKKALAARPGPAWPVNVTVYQLAAGGGEAAPRLVSEQALWNASQALDLRGALGRWLAGPEPRLRLGAAFSADVGPWLGRGTLPLMVETRGRGRPRKARALEEDCGKGDGKCCLRSLRVSFEDIGWADWVVAPRSYSMRFCEGSCPHNYKPASMHAQIKARLHSVSGEAPAPCCVPAAYEPMVLMHYGDGGKVVSQLFENMIVTRCHCA